MCKNLCKTVLYKNLIQLSPLMFIQVHPVVFTIIEI